VPRGSRLFDAIFEWERFIRGFEVQAADYQRADSKGTIMQVGHKPLQQQLKRSGPSM